MYRKIISGAAALALVFSGAAALPAGIADEITITANAEAAQYNYSIDFYPAEGFNWSKLYVNYRDDSGNSETKAMFGVVEYNGIKHFVVEINSAFEPKFISFSDGADNKTAEVAFENTHGSNVKIDGAGSFWTVTANPYEIVDSGKCGENLNWSLDNYGVLTISGTGDMYDYDDHSDTPWKKTSAGSVSKLVLEDGLTSIGSHAFESTYFNNDLVIPSSVKKIGERAFDGAHMASVTISEGAELTIGKMAFSQNTYLTDFVASGTVTSIGEKAFYNCKKLENIKLSKGLTKIESEAFYLCQSLKKIVIPEGVQEIGASAFMSCSALESVTFPETLTTIWNAAFYECHALKSIDLPESLKHIGISTFFDAPLVKEVTVPAGVTEIERQGLGYYKNTETGNREIIPGFTIKGHKGSAAEQYARENGINFVAIVDANDLGNVNGDNKIDQQDLALLQQSRAGWTVDINASAADVTGDGSVTGEDVSLMQQYFAGWNVVFKKAVK